MKKYAYFILSIIILLLIFILSKQETYYTKIKSINLSTDYEIEQVLEDIEKLNVNTVNVPIAIEIPNINSNEIKILDYSKTRAIELIKILNKKDIRVILEPFPWISNGSEYETEYNPNDKEEFFKEWKNILNILIDDIANKYEVYAVIVGSNFTMLEMYEDNWCEVIEFVKYRYSGLVTYKTSWWYSATWDEESINNYNKKLNNKLFSKVDFISIAAYFELSDKKENTVEELVDCLSYTKVHNRGQNVVEEIHNFYKKHNKPIYFGELGFPRRDYASTHPWDSNVSNIVNDKEQARCFQAYKEVFENKEYIKGISIFALGNKGEDKNFYPSKESIEVIYSWYDNVNKGGF